MKMQSVSEMHWPPTRTSWMLLESRQAPAEHWLVPQDTSSRFQTRLYPLSYMMLLDI